MPGLGRLGQGQVKIKGHNYCSVRGLAFNVNAVTVSEVDIPDVNQNHLEPATKEENGWDEVSIQLQS